MVRFYSYLRKFRGEFVKIKSSIVVAAAAGSTIAPNAQAIAQPVLTPNMLAAPAWTWTGFYVGGHLGAAWQKGETNGPGYFDGATQFPFYNATSHTGFTGGGQIGYNWQSGIVVYGLEADFSTLTGSGGTASQSRLIGGEPVSQTSSNDIEWLGTVRARLGFNFGANTLVYATGGWAYGHVKNTHTEVHVVSAATIFSATYSESKVRGGYVAGGGVEYMLAPHWTIRAEGLYVNLGENTLAKPNTGTCEEGCMPVTFTNKAVIARAGINYRF
jgi:outer membrane immunogenic protein